MNKSCLLGGLIVAMPVVLTGCIDQDYDLDGLDTTTQIAIKDLTLPLNLDPITLSDILDIDANDPNNKIQTVDIDGKSFYALKESGSFSSSINIPSFRVETPDVAPTTAKFEFFAPLTKAIGSSLSFEYHLSDFEPQTIAVNGISIDPSLKSLYYLGTDPTKLTVTLSATNIPAYVSVSFPSVQFYILKGLKFAEFPSNYSYDSESGLLTVTDLVGDGKSATVSMDLIGIDFEKYYDTAVSNGKISLKGSVELKGAVMKVDIDPSAVGSATSPDNVLSLSVKTAINDFTATEISGQVQYSLEGRPGLNIAPVDLSGVPDFLNQEGTDVTLANPQLYVNLENPIAKFGVYYKTGLEFTAVRESGRKSYSPVKDIATKPNFAGPYNYQLAPQETSPLPDFTQNLEFIEFPGLSQILSGNGLPSTIDISLINPEVPLQTFNNFRLGQDISAVNGKYEFFAPLALNDGSTIIYTTTEDGWSDDALEDVVIDFLTVEADVTTTLPLGADLTVYPIDTNGKKILSAKAEVKLPAFANNDHIVIRMQGPIRNLDGITLTAVAKSASSEVLEPNQTITLSNLKATVSGNYTAEDNDD